jgi:DNA (cytosine-5)-methyltransferase 1
MFKNNGKHDYPIADGPEVCSPSNKSIEERLRCVDLFAGAGGFTLSAQGAGLKVVAAVELNPNAAKTYRHNICHGADGPTLYEKNILDLDPKKFKARHFSAGAECDIVLGGPPCQGFSAHRIKGAGVGDPRNELILRYFAFVAALKPKVFLMENVPGILWPRHQEFIDSFYEQGAAAGYDIYEPVVIDARDFGVPQRRKRVFILGHQRGIDLKLDWPPVPTHGSLEMCKENSTLLPWVKALAVFERAAATDDPNDQHMNHSEELIKAFKSTPPNGGSRNQSSRTLPCHAKHDGHWDVYGRINPAEPGPTMTTACINPSKGRFVHPTEDHGITVRQAARFQTFPEDFVFLGGLMSSGEQIGNAVPVKLGEALLSRIADALCEAELARGKKEKVAVR